MRTFYEPKTTLSPGPHPSPLVPRSEHRRPPLPPVHRDVGAVHPGGSLREHECHHVGDLLCCAEPPPREFAALELCEWPRFALPPGRPAATGEHDRARA